MALKIPIAHDFICPWCWVALFQAEWLQKEFGAEIEWIGYELFPDELEWPDYPPGPPTPANKPPTPSRFDFILAADGLTLPNTTRPHKMRTHHAHEAVEYAKTEGKGNELVDAFYRAYWEQGLEINDPKVIKKIAKKIVKDVDALMSAVEKRKFAKKIVGFDDPAHEKGIYNVPTYFIGGKRYAEQPYSVLRKVVQDLPKDDDGSEIYADLTFPAGGSGRPYTYINMVATIDGKTVSGSQGESAADLGSKVDHKLMKRIEALSDAVMVGAETVRATSHKWDPKTKKRIVVSASGELPEQAAFFGGEAYIAAPQSATFTPPKGVKILATGKKEVDFPSLFGKLHEMGVGKLLVLGGSELNAELLRADLVDELFLTIAPKVRLGKGVPTYAGGDPFSRDEIQNFKLLEHHVVGDEIYLRYRRERKK